MNAGAPESHVRRRYLATMREATLKMWGQEGLDAVAGALPEDVRQATVAAPVLAEDWLPSRYVMAWMSAVWTTRAARQPKVLSQFIDVHTELGFGRVRRFFLSFATPDMVIEKAPALWKDDNRGGELVVTDRGPGRATMELRDHEYATTQLSRFCITELIRAILVRSRASNVSARGTTGANGALVMHFLWT
jgi:hypothetical protein